MALTLTKLRTGLPQDTLGVLFGCSQSCVSRTVQTVCELLYTHVVPKYLGYAHLSRDDYIQKHHTILATKLFEAAEDACICVMDGTYFYCGKSSNYEQQRGLFSGQKGSSTL